jgi:hypothetical protein
MNVVRTLIAAVAVAVPALSFAQTTDHALTRAEVRAQLVQLKQAGYNPASDYTQYPANLQAALARVDASQSGANAAYGGVTDGTSSSSAAGEHAPASHAFHPFHGLHALNVSHATRASGGQPDVVGLEPTYAHS